MQRRVSVAIVGSRKPTPYGRKVTFELAYNLARRGIVIISGLAYGIDGEAHKGALEAEGTTLAVMAHGLDTVYPATHQHLAERTMQSGALISEYEAGIPAQPYMFLARNRLVSGLADAIVVTEAGERSGTLATVTYGLEQGKEVFAVPGPITSPLSVGPNRLIQQGALPVLAADDILAIIAPHLLQLQVRRDTLSANAQRILEYIRAHPKSDNLSSAIGLPTDRLLQELTSLELSGYIRSVNGAWVID